MINLFPKLAREQYQKTVWGGAIVLCSIIFGSILLLGELYRSFDIVVNSKIDDGVNQRVRVNIDIIFHHVSCEALSLDLQDVTGAHLEDIQYTVHKFRIVQGQYANYFQVNQLKDFEKSLHYPSWFGNQHNFVDDIEDCYGAQLYDEQKCYTCQDVLMAYEAREWPKPQRDKIQQCKYSYLQSHGRLLQEHSSSQIYWVNKNNTSYLTRDICYNYQQVQIQIYDKEYMVEFQEDECRVQFKQNDTHILFQNKSVKLLQQQNRLLYQENHDGERRGPVLLNMQDIIDIQFTQGEGCQFFGHFYIKKVPGNFHFGFHGKGQAALFLGQQYNIEHTINLLEFTTRKGENTLGKYIKTTNPLDRKKTQVLFNEETSYYLKIVESQYQSLTKSQDLYLFTSRQTNHLITERLPSVVFKYDFDPISMQYEQRVSNLGQLLIVVCAVVGGVYSISQYIASILIIFN
ncbi:hypothetical protein pb186bvf_014390 [Paramecium bursaria]